MELDLKVTAPTFADLPSDATIRAGMEYEVRKHLDKIRDRLRAEGLTRAQLEALVTRLAEDAMRKYRHELFGSKRAEG